jgi:hypothetical protein
VEEVRQELYRLVEQDLVSEIKSIGEPTTLSARMSFEDHAFLELASLLTYLVRRTSPTPTPTARVCPWPCDSS